MNLPLKISEPNEHWSQTSPTPTAATNPKPTPTTTTTVQNYPISANNNLDDQTSQPNHSHQLAIHSIHHHKREWQLWQRQHCPTTTTTTANNRDPHRSVNPWTE
jgi:hypothetical protein